MSKIIRASEIVREEKVRQLTNPIPEVPEIVEPTSEIDPVEEIRQAQREAAALLETARSEAGFLLAQAEEEIKNATETGYQQGYQQGVEEGFQAGLDHLIKEMEKFIINLDREAQRAQMVLESQVHGMAARVVQLSTEIAHKVIQRQVQLEPELVIDQIETILRDLSRVKSLAIRVHPSDHQMVKAEEGRFLTLTQGIDKIQIVVDHSLEPGGCIVETDSGGVDASIATQLAMIENLLLEGNRDEDA